MPIFSREQISPLNEKIKVKVTGEDYLPAFEKSLKHFSKSANLPGFRKGMVPAGLIKKMHGQSLFTEEVLKAVEKGLGDYLQKEKVEILAQPVTDIGDSREKMDMNSPGDYEFDFEIGLKPKFVLPEFKKLLHLESYHIEATEKEVSHEIDRFQVRAGKKVEQESIGSPDQKLKVILDPVDKDGIRIENEESLGVVFQLNSFTPAFREQLLGKKTGDKILLFPATDLEPEEINSILKEPEFKKTRDTFSNTPYLMTIEAINYLESHPLDNALFEMLFPGEGVDSEEALRHKIKSQIEHYYKEQSRNRLDNEIFELLVHGIPIELPEAFLKKWLQRKDEKPLTPEEVEQQYPSFDHQLRWTLISERLVAENNFQATMEEVQQQIQAEFQQMYPYLGDTEKATQYLQALGRDKKYVQESYNKVVTRKLFDWLVSQADLEEKIITKEEFQLLPQKHHAHEHEHA